MRHCVVLQPGDELEVGATGTDDVALLAYGPLGVVVSTSTSGPALLRELAHEVDALLPGRRFRHLTRDRARDLAAVLQDFADTERLPE